MRVAIANFGRPVPQNLDFRAYWKRHVMPPRGTRGALFDFPVDWGFHIFALGIHLLDQGIADSAEFWDYRPNRGTSYHSSGVLRVWFANEDDVAAYLDRYGDPDLFINHGRDGRPILDLLDQRCFRVHVPALRSEDERAGNSGAECYLVDSAEHLDDRSMIYVPVVNTRKIAPRDCEKQRDFIYLASLYPAKRHDLLLRAVRGTVLSGHLHPVDGSRLDLRDTRVTTSTLNERDVVELLTTSRIAVYPGDHTSNPAAMWECVAAGLPIVVNERIEGGKHLVVPGVTGELASEQDFRDVMRRVLARRHAYSPRKHFETHWDTTTMLDRYLQFFRAMGWKAGAR